MFNQFMHLSDNALKTVDTAGELVPYGSVKSVVVILTSFWLTVPTVDSETLVAANIIKMWLYPALQVNKL